MATYASIKYDMDLASSATGAGALTLLATGTASGDSTLSFTSNIDSTYDEYVFKFYDLNPATDDKKFQFNLSADGGSNYNVTKTTTFFSAYHDESDTATNLGYRTGNDLAQGTGVQFFTDSAGNGSDESAAGELHLFAPSSTTFVKHFYSRTSTYYTSNYAFDVFVAGYANTTSAVNAVQFSVESGGNFDGTIKLYGIK